MGRGKMFRRCTAVAVAAVAASSMLIGTSGAVAHATFDDTTLTVVAFDAGNLHTRCTVTFTMSPEFSPGPTSLREAVAWRVGSPDCPSVTWDGRVSIADSSPTHNFKQTTALGGDVSVLALSTSQSVDYALGVREVGVITIHYSATSRLGDYCFLTRYAFDIVTRSVRPIAFVACDNRLSG